jgi:hypothetical protein
MESYNNYAKNDVLFKSKLTLTKDIIIIYLIFSLIIISSLIY